MSQSGKPFFQSPEFGADIPAVLPDLLAELINDAVAKPSRARSFEASFADEHDEALTPEILPPDEEMPPATPVNAAMPEFLASLRTLLNTSDPPAAMGGHFPAEAVQDFAHGTNELLNYLLHEVVGTGELNLADLEAHPPEAAQDFEAGTNELLNYLLSQVMNPHYPEPQEDIEYSVEAMADFEAGTQDLLNQLLTMEEEAGGVEPAVPPEPEEDEADWDAIQSDLLDGLIETVEESDEFDDGAATAGSGQPQEQGQEQELDEPPAPEPTADELGHDLLRGLFENFKAPVEPPAATAQAKPSHELGEVPLEYVDESDRVDVERPAGPFELLLDQIDAELPPPPRIRGIAQSGDQAAPAGERFIAFELAGRPYALPFDCVLEADRIPRSTYVPGMPVHLRGVLNLRGEIIPLVDLRTLLGLEARSGDGRMVVIRGAAGKAPLAFVVDRLQGLESFTADEIVSQVPADFPAAGLCRGSASTGGSTTVLLDPGRVTASAYLPTTTATVVEAPPIPIEFRKTDKRNGHV